MAARTTCLVTIHGIGFQEPPREGVAGYADGLHARLAGQLPELSDDPLKQSWQTGASVPVYVQSTYPAKGGTREQGLARLGRWTDTSKTSIDVANAPLVTEGRSVAHVALVYANLEDLGHQGEAAVQTLMEAMAEHGHYNSVLSTLRTVLLDAATAMAPHHAGPAQDADHGVKPRTDVAKPGLIHRITGLWGHHESGAEPTGIVGTLRQVEDDICAYVCRNDARERVRSFVREALLRLAARDDIDALVLNTHSNGTVIGFDTLRELPASAAGRVRAFMTAGSPLRKYAELFAWGHEVGSICAAGRWDNYFDARDPVADPLAHPVGWREGEPYDATKFKPFVSWPSDAAEEAPFPITDHQVDNVQHSSGGGLQAHDYWANTTEYIPALVSALRT